MSIITILTQGYKKNLEDIKLHCCAGEDSFFKAQCLRKEIDIDALASLLERRVILGHPLYRDSPKLADMALELRGTAVHKANSSELAQYIEENDLLYLEGYAIFRMSDYRHKLDMMMYCLIKKLKLTDSLL